MLYRGTARGLIELLVRELGRLGGKHDMHRVGRVLDDANLLASLSKALDKYWDAGRTVSKDAQPGRRGRRGYAARAKRDPKVIRAWATENG